MNRLLLTLIFTLASFNTALAAKEWVWTYPVTSEQDISGFRLMRDGVVEADGILPAARSHPYTAQPDQKDHIYILAAVGKSGLTVESTPYTVKWVAPTIPKPTYFKTEVK